MSPTGIFFCTIAFESRFFMVKGQMRMRRWQEQQSGGGYTLIVGAFPRSPLPPSTIIDPGEMQLRFRIRFGTLLDLFRSAQPPPPLPHCWRMEWQCIGLTTSKQSVAQRGEELSLQPGQGHFYRLGPGGSAATLPGGEVGPTEFPPP